jgi:hypothetical protein
MKNYDNNNSVLTRQMCVRALTSTQAAMNDGNKVLFNSQIYNLGDITYSNGEFTVPKGKLYRIEFILLGSYSNIAGKVTMGIYNGATLLNNIDMTAVNPALSSDTSHPTTKIFAWLDLLNATSNATVSVKLISKTAGSALTINKAEVEIIEQSTTAL